MKHHYKYFKITLKKMNSNKFFRCIYNITTKMFNSLIKENKKNIKLENKNVKQEYNNTFREKLLHWQRKFCQSYINNQINQ